MLIAKKIVDINMIVGYPLSKEDVITWSAEIDRLVDPDDLKKLPFILDCFKTCKLEYDNNLGIRNIFMALKEVIVDEEGNYKLRSARRY